MALRIAVRMFRLTRESCALRQIFGRPLASVVRATTDGGPLEVPEFLSGIFRLLFFFALSLALVGARRRSPSAALTTAVLVASRNCTCDSADC